MAELFLSAFLQVLFDRLAPHACDLWNLARREGLEKKLETLVELFHTDEAVLVDAEEKQLTEQPVKLWLDKLRDLAYDAEDVLDEFSTEALRLRVMAKQATKSKFPNLVPALKFKIKMGSKIDVIMSRLKKISKQKEQLSLVKNGAYGFTHTWQATPTTSSPIEAIVYGRDKDRENILDLLLKDDQSCDVIPIVAMGGAGKTTLAQHVYGDRAVAEAFQSKAWVCVSNDFDVNRVMKAILEDLTSKPCELKELQPIQTSLEEVLAGKKFLLVLDDIWDHTFIYDKWLALRSLFQVGASGSKMIVTTRQEIVATTMGTIKPYKLELLSDEDCWHLFKTHAFNKRYDHVGLHLNLESIREMIVSRCKGLPLAARTLGGLLCCRPTDKWEDILNDNIWSMHGDEDGDVLPVLRLSYHYLPPQLKKCFIYCAIFPPDYEFTEEKLVLLWIAEGFIQQKGKEQVIQKARMYFREFVSRSLFQVSGDHNSKFIMHDLVHELAQRVGGEMYFRWDDVEESQEKRERIKRARHSSLTRRSYDTSRRFEGFHKAQCLRTFLVFPPLQVKHNVYSNIANSVLHRMSRLTKLRVLSFNGYKITELPDSIGNLEHLRYLDLASTKIRCLPESTCSLHNLQILSLKDCKRLQNLPSKMENLISLCYLDITNAFQLQHMPIGLKELKSLQVLSNFIVGKGRGCGVKELMNFKGLSGTICISNLENVVDAREAKEASLNEKKNLEVLELEWGSRFRDFRNVEAEKSVLDMLQPNQNLKELMISSYGGNTFSTWLGDPLFSSINIIKLENCKRCTYLPPLGQLPSLKILEISEMHRVKSIGAEFYGSTQSKAFPSLESLSFMYMPEWENWSGFDVNEQVEGFSRLSVLSIKDCPNLLGILPNHLPSLKKLEVRKCATLRVLIASFPKLYELEIDGCQDIVRDSTIEFTQVKQLELNGNGCEELINSNLPCTIEYILSDCQTLERLPMNFRNLTHLKMLVIDGCSSLVSLSIALFLLPVLGIVKIYNCDSLRTLIDEVIDSESSSTTVAKKLYVRRCPSLECLSSTGVLPALLSNISVMYCSKLEFVAKTLHASLLSLVIEKCSRLEFVAETFMENMKLKSIALRHCQNFQWLPEGMQLLSHLEYINIKHCPNFLSFPQGGLPNNKLKELYIYGCRKLKVLPNGIGNITSLTSMEIIDCENIKFVLEDGFFTNLTKLSLRGCTNIEEILMNLPISLTKLDIGDCPKLISLPNLHVSLTQLNIWDCPVLISLPNLPISLIKLFISYCNTLISLPNLPISLTQLNIYKCPKLISLPNLSTLSLTILNISNCPTLVSLPNLLPISLIELDIKDCPNLKYISSNCFRDLASLQILRILNCPKLTSLPKEGMPSSLLQLYIDDCPLMKKQCRRDKGKDWHKIADIPYVEIDEKSVYDPEPDNE